MSAACQRDNKGVSRMSQRPVRRWGDRDLDGTREGMGPCVPF
jgi:hypothetical protein